MTVSMGRKTRFRPFLAKPPASMSFSTRRVPGASLGAHLMTADVGYETHQRLEPGALAQPRSSGGCPVPMGWHPRRLRRVRSEPVRKAAVAA